MYTYGAKYTEKIAVQAKIYKSKLSTSRGDREINRKLTKVLNPLHIGAGESRAEAEKPKVQRPSEQVNYNLNYDCLLL